MSIAAPPDTHRSAARRRWRLGVVGGVVAAVVATYGVATALHADAAETLLSQGKPATASSTESAAFPASAAVDGNTGTRWSSAFSDPQWLQVDLGASSTISSVVLNWESAYARSLSVKVSATGSSWTTLYNTTAGTG